MLLSVIIPTIKGKLLLKDSLPGLYEAIRYANIKNDEYEVIVIDNAQNAVTKRYVTSQYSNISYTSSTHNLGFAASVNLGIDAAQGRFILILNDDCFVKKTTIQQMIQFLTKNPNIYFTQPVILEGGKSTIGYRLDLNIAKAFPINDMQEWREKRKQTNNKNPFMTSTLFGVSATCLLAKKEVFAMVGKFDASFHSYLEDVEFCLRASLSDIAYFPTLTASATHLHMQTSKTMKSYKSVHDFKNWIRIIAKHYPKTFIIKHFLSLTIERFRNAWGIVKQLLKQLYYKNS